ncbi:DUF1800 domain-containing protein [Polaribacter glomeratus]|uniref:DUF1800 domain-containing protein n=1 Tax=Polaribacter glomeratus TaxID=102 RepID=A0A2S7WGW2_9FLAO|nr:DUF1800 domain-containing protein [Polaribacter glomeratus]PQJ76854.1 hypothetical protein BTO16_13365 [Polaribacter glomeratus]TXD67303.1 DUF1800 domain-containing protein [Polaribacter glomeratus]
MKSIHIQHLYNRIGFGITPKELKRLAKKSKKNVINELFNSSKKITPLTIDISFLKDITAQDYKDKQKQRELQKISRQKVHEFSVAWVYRLMNPSEILREKMTLFWTNHFVCENKNILFIQEYNNVLRTNALGNFSDFTKIVSKQAAMLNYLNNKQNKKKSPNENFARELMELFTLGQDKYTQTDIKESAIAFTGYVHNFKGEVILRKKDHDENEKTFLGKTGNFNGDAIIDIILEKEQCAKFISEKIYSYFVNEKINKSHVEEMTAVFYKEYNIEKLMRFVLLSEWFYADENIGVKIKSPIEFIVGINTIVPFTFEKEQQILLVQKLLGQVLMSPPNVAGWKTGRNWIDSNTIVTRLRLPSVLLNNAEITYSDKGDEESTDANFDEKKLRRKAFIKTKTAWKTFDENYKNSSHQELMQQVITTKLNAGTAQMLLNNMQMPKQDFCVQLMSLPEYQLC